MRYAIDLLTLFEFCHERGTSDCCFRIHTNKGALNCHVEFDLEELEEYGGE